MDDCGRSLVSLRARRPLDAPAPATSCDPAFHATFGRPQEGRAAATPCALRENRSAVPSGEDCDVIIKYGDASPNLGAMCRVDAGQVNGVAARRDPRRPFRFWLATGRRSRLQRGSTDDLSSVGRSVLMMLIATRDPEWEDLPIADVMAAVVAAVPRSVRLGPGAGATGFRARGWLAASHFRARGGRTVACDHPDLDGERKSCQDAVEAGDLVPGVR